MKGFKTAKQMEYMNANELRITLFGWNAVGGQEGKGIWYIQKKIIINE